MFIAKVTGSVVSTQKVDTMVGHRLLVVEPYRLEPKDRKSLVTTGRTFIAVDMLGSGVGDYVLITQGSSARMTPETKTLPIDCVVVGIVDRAHVENQCVYDRDDDNTDEPTEKPKTTTAAPDRGKSQPKPTGPQKGETKTKATAKPETKPEPPSDDSGPAEKDSEAS